MDAIALEQFAAMCGGEWTSAPAAGQSVSAVCIDSRQAGPGTAFFALPGTRVDGHAFAAAVLAAGGIPVVRADWSGAASLPGPCLRVPDVEAALLRFAGAYRRTQSARVVGVTGSVGKTSTKELLADALATRGRTVRTEGNLNNQLGLPLSLCRLERGVDFGVFEAGVSHPGDMPPLAGAMSPDAMVTTRVGPVHLEYFGTIDAIAREKALLAAAVPPSGFAVLDTDAPEAARFAEVCPGRVVTCARADSGIPADYVSSPLPDPARFVVAERATGERRELAVPPPGGYMADNWLRVVACARQFGVSWDALDAVAAAYRPVGFRGLVETLPSGLVLVNDAYNANPVSVRASAEAFVRRPPAARRWLLLGPMLELGPRAPDFHRDLAADLAANPAFAGLCVADWRPDAAPLAAALLDGWRSVRPPAPSAPADLASSPADAADWLRAHAAPGDAALLKASRGIALEQVAALLKKDPLQCSPTCPN